MNTPSESAWPAPLAQGTLSMLRSTTPPYRAPAVAARAAGEAAATVAPGRGCQFRGVSRAGGPGVGSSAATWRKRRARWPQSIHHHSKRALERMIGSEVMVSSNPPWAHAAATAARRSMTASRSRAVAVVPHATEMRRRIAFAVRTRSFSLSLKRMRLSTLTFSSTKSLNFFLSQCISILRTFPFPFLSTSDHAHIILQGRGSFFCGSSSFRSFTN
mmetsp:Transcript_43785/g.91682  ORF Transcript_43785/g.91682 Transcript_43785/m.91682 type:complete len:216 (-) Transcript_43785:465-1112(-)